MTLFEKIVAREIPAKIIAEDDDLIVFYDVNPQAPIHVLLVPKKPIPRLAEATPEDAVVWVNSCSKLKKQPKRRNIEDRLPHRHQQWT